MHTSLIVGLDNSTKEKRECLIWEVHKILIGIIVQEDDGKRR